MIIVSTTLTVPAQPSPQLHVEAWLPFKNREKVYNVIDRHAPVRMKRVRAAKWSS